MFLIQRRNAIEFLDGSPQLNDESMEAEPEIFISERTRLILAKSLEETGTSGFSLTQFIAVR